MGGLRVYSVASGVLKMLCRSRLAVCAACHTVPQKVCASLFAPLRLRNDLLELVADVLARIPVLASLAHQ